MFYPQEIASEISGLEKQRDQLEAELKKVLSLSQMYIWAKISDNRLLSPLFAH